MKIKKYITFFNMYLIFIVIVTVNYSIIVKDDYYVEKFTKPIKYNDYKILNVHTYGSGHRRSTNALIYYNGKNYEVSITLYEDYEAFMYYNKNRLNSIFYYSVKRDKIIHISDFTFDLLWMLIILNLINFSYLIYRIRDDKLYGV